MNARIRQYDPNLSNIGIHDRKDNRLQPGNLGKEGKIWNSPCTKHRLYKQPKSTL